MLFAHSYCSRFLVGLLKIASLRGRWDDFCQAGNDLARGTYYREGLDQTRRAYFRLLLLTDTRDNLSARELRRLVKSR
jgi:hypothetical protein